MKPRSLLLLAAGLTALQCHAVTFNDWLVKTDYIRSQAERLTPENCQPALDRLAGLVDNWMPEKSETDAIRRNGPAALKSSFQARMALRAQLKRLPTACAESMRVVF